MICPKCGQELADGVKFCFKCGTDVTSYKAPEKPAETENPAAAEENRPSFCTKCGAPMAAEMKFCAKCGTPAGGSRPKGPGIKLNKKLFTIGGCALAGIIVVIVLIAILAGGRASTPEAIGKACFNARIDGDAEGYYDLFCTPVLRRMSGISEDATRKEMVQKLAEKGVGGMEDAREYGLKIKVKDVTSKTVDEPSVYSLYYFTEEELDSVEEYAKVTVTLEYSMQGMTQTDKETVYCVKIDGRWYLLDD